MHTSDPFFVWFSCSLLLAFTVERILNAFFTSVIWLVIPKSGMQRYASLSVIRESASGVVDSLVSVVPIVTNFLSRWSTLALLFFMILIGIGVQSQSSTILLSFYSVYNNPVSAFLRDSFLQSLRLTKFFSDPFILLWNFFTVIVKRFFVEVLLPVTKNMDVDILNLARAFFNTFKYLMVSIISYVSRLRGECDTRTGLDAIYNATSMGEKVLCFVPGTRNFDLVNPLAEFRVVVAYMLILSRRACGLMSVPLDAISLPFLDSNFGLAVHNFVNAILYWFVSMPLTTIQRCQVSKDIGTVGWRALLFCLPDVAPGFSYLVAAIRYTGRLVDNTLNLVWLLILNSLNLNAPTCAAIPLSLQKPTYDATLFGNNFTRVVGLSSHSYALTDGYSILWSSFVSQPTDVYAPYAWQLESTVDLQLGLAAVKYSSDLDEAVDVTVTGTNSDSIMGCRCDDILVEPGSEQTYMQIKCAIARYQPANVDAEGTVRPSMQPEYFNVSFFRNTTAQYYKCRETQIVVDSARYPLWRLGLYEESGKVSSLYDPLNPRSLEDGTDRNTEIDAVVWVKPLCSLGDTPDIRCVETFPEAGDCYPACLAVRKTGSMQDGLLLRNINDWEDGVLVLNRDCSVDVTAASGEIEYFEKNGVPLYNYSGLTWSDLDEENGRFFFRGSWDPTSSTCRYHPQADTFVNRGTSLTRGSDVEKYEAIRLAEQPFTMSGEVALFEGTDSDGQPEIIVKRLFGQQGTGFISMITLPSKLPALRPCNTPSDCNDESAFAMRLERATIPYSASRDLQGGNIAVTTRYGVIYAVNPDFSTFQAFYDYCEGKNSTDMQIIVYNSIGRLRLFKVAAFSPQGPTKSTGTYRGFINGSFADMLDISNCGRSHLLGVVAMEVIDDLNVAVTVAYGNPAVYDSRRGNMNALQLTYKVLYLNSETMATRETDLWHAEDSVASLSIGLLCPSQRVFPEFGSAAAEAIASLVLMVKVLSEVIITSPATFQAGAYLDLISPSGSQSLGHSMLMVNSGWYDVDLIFESLSRAQFLFWNTFSKLGSLFPKEPYINQFLNGVALRYESYTPLVVEPMKAYLGAADRMTQTVDSTMTGMLQRVSGKIPIMYTGFSSGAGLIKMAQFAARTSKRWMLQVILPSIDSIAGTGSGQTVANSLWQTVSDGFERDYVPLILNSELKACTGLRLMAGYDSPPARLAGSICESVVYFKKGAVQVLLAFFVDIPLLHCVCQADKASSWRTRIHETCIKSAPVNYRGTLSALLAEEADLQVVCNRLSGHVQTKFLSAMDRFLESSFASVRIAGGAIDYMRVFWDDEAGSCSDFIEDESLTTIIPDPPDWWRVCTTTTTCRRKCLSSIESFENSRRVNNLESTRLTVPRQTTVESKYFSEADMLSGQNAPPFDIEFMSEIASCVVTCGISNNQRGDRCVAVGGKNKDGLYTVAEYCVPSRIDSFVYLHTTWSIANSNAWSWGADVIDIAFGYQDAGHMCPSHYGAFCSLVVLFYDRLSTFREDGKEYVIARFRTPEFRDMRPDSLTVLGNSLIIVSGFAFDFETRDRTEMAICVDTRPEEVTEFGKFSPRLCNEQNVFDKTTPKINICEYSDFTGCRKLLQIPTVSDLENVVFKEFENGDMQSGILRLEGEVWPVASGAIASAGLFQYSVVRLVGGGVIEDKVPRSRNIVVSNSVSKNQRAQVETGGTLDLFVANHPKRKIYGWLSVIRLDNSGNSIRTASGSLQQITVNQEIGCSLKDCRGCQDETTRTLCWAAQSCTLVRCMGTAVSLDRFLCAGGKLFLSDTMELFLQQWQAMWNLLVGVLVETISLATTREQSQHNVNLLSDAFLNQVCLMKDIIYDSSAFVTSMINTNMNQISGLVSFASTGQSIFYTGSRVQSMVNRIDEQQAHAERTLVMASITRLLGNIGLGALYPALIANKVMTCQGNDLVAVMNAAGFEITIFDAATQELTDNIVGTCLSNYELQGIETPDTEESVLSAVVTDTIAFFGGMQYTPIKHLWDGVLSYLMSVVRGFQDVFANVFPKYCRLPDPTASQLGTCACGDQAVEIPRVRATEGLAEHAFWCTGILQLSSPFGEAMYIFNPYSYSFLLDFIEQDGKMAEYFSCIESSSSTETSCSDLEPNLPIFEEQGVSILSVLNRCKLNYMSAQWDPGASLIYASELLPDYLFSQMMNVKAGEKAQEDYERYLKLDVENGPHANIHRCMEQAVRQKTSNEPCLTEKIRSVLKDYTTFFSYSAPENDISPFRIAACEGFTGPMETLDEQDSQFHRCKHSNSLSSDKTCSFPPFLWTSRSRNNIPVAKLHAFGNSNRDERLRAATSEIQTIKERVLEKVRKIKTRWDQDVLDLGLFTSEGDTLHQAADCFMLGPYGAVELFPTDIDRTIDTVLWARDSTGATRSFDLPCTGAKLNGETKPPFTCGSPARRHLIRKFVQRLAGNEEASRLKSIVNEQIQETFNIAENIFNVPVTGFGCQCADNDRAHFDCCEGVENQEAFLKAFRQMPDEERDIYVQKLLPGTLKNFNFDKIESYNITYDIVFDLYEFLNTEVWLQDMENMSSLTDTEEEVAKTDAYLRTTKTLFAFDEVMQRENVSALELCVGALSQTIFTLPVVAESGEPTTLNSMPKWDPVTATGDEYFSALELWLQKLSSDSLKKSPLHWSHNFKQVPSTSGVCAEVGSEEIPSTFDESLEYFTSLKSNAVADFSMQPLTGISFDSFSIDPPNTTMLNLPDPLAWTLGNLTAACFCGWDTVNDTSGFKWCVIPESVCGVAVQGTKVFEACVLRAGLYWQQGENSEVGQVVQEMGLSKNDCPWNRVDPAAWGLIEQQSMEQYLQGDADEDGVRLSVKDILYHGRGGFRYMNTIELVERGRDNPLTRYFNLQNSAASIIQDHCESVLKAKLDSDAWKNRFVAEFFPTVQPVRENRVLAYCLRYTTELAFQTALETVFDTDHFTLVEQINTVDVYRRRCLTQVKLMGFCHLRGVFESISSSSGYHRDEECTLFANLIEVPLNQAVHVVGENCLILHHEQCEDCSTTVYDPCSSGLCYGGEDLSFATVQSECEPLDLSPLLTERAKAMTLHWSPPSDPHWSSNIAARQQVADATFGHQIGLKIDMLWQKYVLGESGTDALPNFGDTDSFWGTQEGKRADDSRAFCGGAPDWFPSDWEHPVGYHVSTQCSGTVWRSFANHFSYNSQSGTLDYSHTAHRDNLATHAGSSGLCRLHTYDTPVREQHNVRFCTRLLQNERIDYSIPLLEKVNTDDTEQTFGSESCSQSPYDVPWSPGDREEARFTTSALLTSWPTDDNVWPSEFMDLGLANHSGPFEWEHQDGSCGMPPVFICISDDDCMENILRTGEQITLQMRCLSGVCHVVSDSESPESFIECTAHHHCDEELLCSGEGRCVMPLVELANLGEDDVEFSMFSDSCDESTTQKVDMRGKSPWGRIHSLLRTYGLCSYRSWYNYRTVVERCQSDESYCTLDQNDQWVDTLNAPTTIYQTTSNGLLYQDAHVCDREYSYSQGTYMCRPVQKEGVEKNFFVVDDARTKVDPTNIRYSSLYETYYHDTSGRLKLKLGAMTNGLQNKALGFIDEVRNWTSLNLLPCNTIKQCSEPPFSIRGRNGILRRVCQNNPEECRSYDLKDAVLCGSFGFLKNLDDENSACKVDLSILPMYHILCKDSSNISSNCVTWSAEEKSSKCLMLTQEYPSGMSTDVLSRRGQIQSILDEMMQEVWNGSFSSLNEYDLKSRCGHYVYSWLESAAINEADNIQYTVEDDGIMHSLSTLFFFTTFSHYEIPPAFWLKCIFLSGTQLSATSSTNCDAWLEGGGRDGSEFRVGQTMTVREWLIRKVPLINLQDAFESLSIDEKHRQDVKNRFLQSLQGVNNTFSGHFASCYEDRRWRHKVRDDCEKQTEDLNPLKYMVYKTLEQGFLPMQTAFQPQCCKKMDCVPSTFGGQLRRGNPAKFKRNFMADVYNTILREDVSLDFVSLNENVLNENVQILDPDGTVEVPVFMQPWLDSSTKFDEFRRNVKVQLLHLDTWRTIETDECLNNVYTLDTYSYISQMDTTRQCIYDDPDESDPDQLNKDTALKSDSAVIKFWRFKDQSNIRPSKEMPVCFTPDLKTVYVKQDNDLKQPCSLRHVNDNETSFYPPYQETFTCSATDTLAVGCYGRDHSIRNPHPERVCFQHGSSCTSDDFDDDKLLATKKLYGIAKWKLPPGVKIRFYRRPPSGGDDWPFGRNPSYLRPHEKLYYKESFTDREYAENLKVELFPRFPQYMGSFEQTVRDEYEVPSRRLLSFNDSEETTARLGRKLLQVTPIVDEMVSGDCPVPATIRNLFACHLRSMRKNLETENLMVGEKGYPPPDWFASSLPIKDRKRLMRELMDHPYDNWFCGPAFVSLEDVYNLQQNKKDSVDLSHPVYIEDANVPQHGGSALGIGTPWPLRCGADAKTCSARGYRRIKTSAGGELWVKSWEWIDRNNNYKGRPSCVRCKNNEVKIPRIWNIQVGAIYYNQPGCYRCPNNMVAQPWQSCASKMRADAGHEDCCTCPKGQIRDSSGTKCITQPVEATPGPVEPKQPFKFVVESIERMNIDPAPYLSWEVFPKDGNITYSRGFTMLESYNGKDVTKKYPPWYNCLDADDINDSLGIQTLRNLTDTEFRRGGSLYSDFQNWLDEQNDGGSAEYASLQTKLEYIAHQYHENTALQDMWFDYDSPALPSFDAEDGSEVQDIEIFRSPDNYWAFSLELYDGYKCGRNSCDNGKKAVQIREGYFYCGTCRKMPPFDRYCTGTHSCRFNIELNQLSDPDPGSTPEWQLYQYTKIKEEHTDGFTFSDSITLALHLSMLQYRQRWLEELPGDFLLRTNSTYLTETVLYNIDSATAWDLQLPGPGAALDWEGSQGEYQDSTGTLDIQKCLSNTGFATQNRINYRLCQNDNKMNALKRIVDDLYNRSGVPVVKPEYSMILPLSAIQLKKAHTIFSWAAAKRPGKENFISYILDSERQCLQADRLTSVCRIEAGQLELFNPWMGGDISLRNGCDIAPDTLPELISTRCTNGNECPAQDSTTPFYRYQVPGCKEEDGELARRLVPRGICGIRPTEKQDQCNHKQGILGGGKGTPQTNLYDYSDVVSFDGTDIGGVFTLPRRLFFSQREFLESVGISKRTFHIHEKDIGSHFVFALQDELLKLVDVVLSGSATTIEDREEEARQITRFKNHLHNLDWMLWDEVAEDIQAREIEPDLPATSRHWACPIKQRIYLSGSNNLFRPLLPNPRRAQIMFEAHHGGYRSSTVQKLGEDTSVFTSHVVTPNGNCFCTNPADCTDTIFDESPCTFFDTFRSLVDSEWRSSKSRTYTTCKKQYDWPNTGGKLRDGTFVSSASTNEQSCYLLDRLHDFKYRYKTVTPTQNGNPESNLRSGDCHTARTAGSPDRTWNPAEVRRCSECQARPSFTAGGRSIPSETSFGIPYRISSSRLIAEELKSKLRHGICGSNEVCEQYSSLLNVSLFVPDRFWDAFWNDSKALLNPDVLYPKRNITSIYDKLETAETDLSMEDDLWNIPWIYCDKIIPNCREHCTAESNCVTICDSNNTVGSCIGSMNRETWFDPNKRRQSCLNQISDAGNSKPSTFSMNLCDVDTLTDEFCKEIANAKQKIFEINCQITGICTTEAFFYTPSVFSIANQEFVRDTVESFYLRMDENSCPQRDTESAAIQQSNSDVLYKCPATAMQTLYNLLDSLRAIIELLIRIMYYSNLMFLNMIRLIFLGASSSESAAASAEVWKYFQLLINTAGDLLKEFAEMLIEMVLYNSELGPVLMRIIEVMCWFIHEWQKFMLKTIMCALVNAGIEILRGLSALFDMRDALDWMYALKQETCYAQPIDCNFTDPFGGDFVPPFSLPVATRCWSSYLSRYGEGENSLSCSAADTCYAKDLSTFGEDPLPGSTAAGLLACDACPTPTDFTESRFGCDLFTRSCKCGVQNIRKTTCINNYECSVAPDSTCQILDSLLNADPYGMLSCSACTGQKVCLVDPMSDGVGYCACSREPISPLSCGQGEIGETYQTAAGTMCYAAVGGAVRDEISEQVSPKISAHTLALSRCDLLNPSARRCSFVEFLNGETGFYVIGSKTVSQGRRLLSDDSLIPRLDFALPAQALDDAEARGGWESVQSEICRFTPLLKQDNTSLSITDRYHLRHCIRWRAIGFEVLTQLNLQNKIPDTFLLGLQDFSTDILSHPSRIGLFIANPSIPLLSFLHSEMMTPVRSMLRSLRQFVTHMSVEIEGARMHVQASNLSFDYNISRKEMQNTLYAIGIGKSVARYLVNNPWRARGPGSNATLEEIASDFNKTVHNASRYYIRALHTVPVFSSNHNRKLLQTTDFIQRLEDVSDYSKEIALGNGDLQILGTAAATAYTQGPSTWPSEFKYWEQESACALVSNFVELVSKSGTLAARSMKNISDTQINISYNILDALATVLAAPSQQVSDMQRIVETTNKLPWYLQFVAGWGEQLGIDFGYFARLLSKAPNMLYDIVSCDIEGVVLCQKHQYSLVTSAIVASIILSVVGVLSSLVGLPTLPLVFSVISFWSIVMYVSFGYSPLCFPLVPQCAAASLVQDMERLLPTRFEIPPALVTCSLDQATAPPPNCIAECENEPFAFRDFHDNIIFSMCQASLPLCAGLESWIVAYQNLLTNTFGRDFVEGLLHSVLRSTVILRGDTNMITASSWCNIMTFYKALPVLFLVTVGLSIVPLLIGVLFRVFSAWVRVAIASFQMTHIDS
jgi:hypothetical protein